MRLLRRKNSLTATVDDSYFSGTQNIGAIVGSLGDNAVVDNCVSYAVVEGIGIDTGSHAKAVQMAYNFAYILSDCE